MKGKQRKNDKYHSYKGTVGKVADNLLKRDFYAEKPFEKITTDVTQFNVCDEKVYAEFKGVNFIDNNFSRGVFTHSNFAGAKFCECEVSCVNMQSCCIDETEFGDLNLTSVNLSDCSYDEQEWTEETLGEDITM